MCTSFNGVDIVHIGVDILIVVSIVHHSHLDGYALLLCLQIYHIIEEMGAMPIYIAHKLLETLLGMEHLLLGVALLIGAQVGQGDGDTCIEICQFAHALGYDFVFVLCGGKDRGIGPELLACSTQIGLAHHLH